MVRATFDALTPRQPAFVAGRRNIKVSALQARRRDGDGEQAATE
jgi:small subunit ribosomal protein S5